MCERVGALICLLAVVGGARATDIDIYFNSYDIIRDWEPQAPEIPFTQPGIKRVYIWANIDMYDSTRFNGMGLDFVEVGDVTVVDGVLYNPNMGAETGSKGQTWEDYKKFRWQNGALGGSEPDNPIGIQPTGSLDAYAVSGTWLLQLGYTPAYGDYAADPGDTLAWSEYDEGASTWVGSYLLGHVDVETAGDGDIYFAVSAAKITAQGGDEGDMVYFGLNPPVPQRVVGAGGPGTGRIPDVTFVPGPDRGDLDCDGYANNSDVDPFVLAITSAELYAMTYPDCDIMSGDCNYDGATNNGDIDAFVQLLTASPSE